METKETETWAVLELFGHSRIAGKISLLGVQALTKKGGEHHV